MKKVLFMVNRDFVLYNFRIELVQKLLKEDYQVFICLPFGEKVKEMISMGCKFIPVEIDKRGTNPFKDFLLMQKYRRIFCDIKPDIILLYTTKVCIYGGLVAGKMNIPYLINVSGLGTAVENKGPLQILMIQFYRHAAKHAKCLFFQNEENQKFFHKYHIYQGKQKLIPGSGVNIDRWYLMEYPSDKESIEFLFIARVIKEKGIEEYLAAAKKIKKEYPKTIFHVLGPCDEDYQDILNDYERWGIIQYHGMVQDTREYLKRAHCTIHPSFYPEGMSNVLLESAACGRPVITTKRSGCREVVEDGITGYLFEQKNREQLIEKIRQFMQLSNEERRKMGVAGREKVVREFDRNIVIDAYLTEICVSDGL